jgi:hypothetical protein
LYAKHRTREESAVDRGQALRHAQRAPALGAPDWDAQPIENRGWCTH